MAMLILIDLLVELVVWRHVNIKITIMIYSCGQCRLLTISVQFSSKYHLYYLI